MFDLPKMITVKIPNFTKGYPKKQKQFLIALNAAKLLVDSVVSYAEKETDFRFSPENLKLLKLLPSGSGSTTKTTNKLICLCNAQACEYIADTTYIQEIRRLNIP